MQTAKLFEIGAEGGKERRNLKAKRCGFLLVLDNVAKRSSEVGEYQLFNFGPGRF